MKLGLGTVQLGLDYGISNGHGRPDVAESRAILELANARAVRIVDTAPAYGDAETVLGELSPCDHGFAFVTKTPPCGDGDAPEIAERLESALRGSLERLRARSAYGLLVHRPDDLLGASGAAVHRALRRLCDAGLVAKIGASVYTPEQLEAITASFELDMVQVPVSVLDQRLIDGGHLERLAARGLEIHARSVFLQGLLLMEEDALPPALAHLRAPLGAFRSAAAEQGATPLTAALAFVASLPEVASVVCGVNRRKELEEILAAIEEPIDTDAFRHPALRVADERWLDPSRWPEAAR